MIYKNNQIGQLYKANGDQFNYVQKFDMTMPLNKSNISDISANAGDANKSADFKTIPKLNTSQLSNNAN